MPDYQYFNDQGVIVPDTSTTRAEVIQEFRDVFGQDLVVDPSTPQGQLITRITELRDAVARNNADVANQINPALASGRFLDALVGLSGAYRKPATKSIISQVTLGGTPGTLIPAGSMASTNSGQVFELAQSITIPSGGTIDAAFVARDTGPIGAPIGTLVNIESSILGWLTVTNPVEATLGRDIESDAALRRRRNGVLATQSMSITESLYARLNTVSGVSSFLLLENPMGSTQTVQGISMAAHSVWACVDGGVGGDIALALFKAKTPGTVWATPNTTNYNVNDPITGVPYVVKFARPSDVLLLIRVTISTSKLPAQTLIPEYVMNYVNGSLPGDVSFTVGTSVSPFEIAAAINAQEPSFNIRKVEISLVGSGTWSSDVYAIASNQIARTQLSSISVVQV